MEMKHLEITMNSARGLKKVNHLHAMDVYAVVTLSSNPQTEQRTPVDKGCGSKPMWNHTMKFTFDEAVAKMNYLFLNIKLKHHGHIRGDKDIGEVLVPVKELLDKAEEGNFVKYLTYQVRESSGKPQGELNLSYRFEDDTPIVTAYPPPHVGTSSSSAYIPSRLNIPQTYNPPQSSTPQSTMGYPSHGRIPPPPPLPEGYPTPPPGLGYHHHGKPQVVQPQQPAGKNSGNNNVGLELGMAVVGGMLGGILLGELVYESDDGASNDAENTR
ncbi:protein SRC2 homolog isoform X2 [Quercus robur]|uniref:protein SRC2 homolog isoform X2 n=1 Tax=Quercus robur TaxID=38942 RepID=UPI002162C515|nr:protein SRC2 homolog isoform X2 [Quercus robur]